MVADRVGHGMRWFIHTVDIECVHSMYCSSESLSSNGPRKQSFVEPPIPLFKAIIQPKQFSIGALEFLSNVLRFIGSR